MSNINLVKCANPIDALDKSSEDLDSILEKWRDADVPVLLLMSGGSALKIADRIKKESLPKNFTLGVSDDRYSTDPTVNNFAQLSKTKIYRDALESNAHFIDTRIDGKESLEELGERFDGVIKKWRERHPDGKILVTQGVGPDGHTGGIMPYPEDEENFKKLFIDTEKYAIGYDAQGKNQYSLRITVTLKFLMEQVEESVLFMTGQDKKTVFQNMFDVSHALTQTPARVIHEMKKVNLFTDIK